MLISNQIDSVYNGVNQQSPEHRLETQVKRMDNAYPTINQGLLKRNPTSKLDLSLPITYTSNMWSHTYDRGISGNVEEKYSIQITESGMEIVNVITGKVYKKTSNLLFSGNAESYLSPFGGANGYSAVTIKDTTFIVNKNKFPAMNTLEKGDEVATPSTRTVYNSTLSFANYDNIAPSGSCFKEAILGLNQDNLTSTSGSVTTVIVDSQSIVVDVASGTLKIKSTIDPYEDQFYVPTDTRITFEDYFTALTSKLEEALSPSLYVIDVNGYDIKITRLDGSTITVTVNIVENSGTCNGVYTPMVESNYYTGQVNSSEVTDIVLSYVDYESDGFMWFRGANPTSGYTYTIRLEDNAAVPNIFTQSVTNTTTDGAATALAALINADAAWSAEARGSIIKVKAQLSTLKSIDASDTWGNQATTAWGKEIQDSNNLPKNMLFNNVLVKVTGSTQRENDAYWLKYSDGIWRESLDNTVDTKLQDGTLPHILVRNSNDTFTFKEYDGWVDRKVGDDITNKLPSFIGSPIRDIFFFKNRLGFITERDVAMSEVGEYGNFWRTTVATVLDSDPIDTTVDNTSVVSLQFATYLEDSIILFSDKTQFKLSGGNVLSPKSIQISQTSAYEFNKDIKPLLMNNKIFFVAKRGDYTAVMQYQIAKDSGSSEAVEISSHVQNYIPSDVATLQGSSVDNMLFITTKLDKSSIYVYKYFDSANTRIQSAWFKWTFNGEIFKIFSLSSKLNLLIKRKVNVAVEDWVMSSGVWDNSKLWDNSRVWVMIPDSLELDNQFETMDIFPQPYTSNFLDNEGSDNETSIPVVVNLGEWVLSVGGRKDIRGHLKFKTIQISSEEDSDFSLKIHDRSRNDTRTVSAKYTVDRNPMVYGDAKNIEVSIRNSSNLGFKINTISYEGSLVKRDRRY